MYTAVSATVLITSVNKTLIHYSHHGCVKYEQQFQIQTIQLKLQNRVFSRSIFLLFTDHAEAI